MDFVRALQGLSQNQLAALTGISQSTISGIEHDRVNLGVERAKVIGRALTCHPAVLVFPGWALDKHAAASGTLTSVPSPLAEVEHRNTPRL